MRKLRLISFVFTLLIEAKCHGSLHSGIIYTSKMDNQAPNNNAQNLFNYSLDIDNESKTPSLRVKIETLNITRDLQQVRKQSAYKEIRGFSKYKNKFKNNLTGSTDFENGNSETRPFNLYDDEALGRGNIGKSSGQGSRLDGFDMTEPKDNPYAVMLVEFLDDHAYFGICSGTLIALEWVLTAASHCFTLADITEIEIHAGGYSKKEWLDNKFRPGHQMIPSVDYYIHPSFKEQERFVDYYDIALVRADSQFKSTRSVSVMMISTEPWMHIKYKRCKATGFGRVQYFEKHPREDYVRKTHPLAMKSPCPCLEKEMNSHSWICARPRENVGICGNDWGAGLICNDQLTAVATEVIAFDDFQTCESTVKPRCAKNNTLSVFQNIHPCLSWINEYVDLSYNKKFDDRRIEKNTSGGFKERGLAYDLRFSLVVVLSGITLTQLIRTYL